MNLIDKKLTMKNLFIYYFLMLAPIGLIFWYTKTQDFDSGILVFLIIFYALIYRTILDGAKLANKNIIAKKDIWKLIIPGFRYDYFRELYFRR